MRMQKKWSVAQPISEEYKQQFPEINPIVLQLLYGRGITTQLDIDEFLRADWSHDIHDPFLFSGMDVAVSRIFKAIEHNESIVVFGDYDADGVCGTMILLSALQRIGAQRVVTYIPHRATEGYGLNRDAIDSFASNNVDLIVTVDLGVSNIDEIAHARALGMDVIVVDHHEFHENDQGVVLPDAHAIIHARTPGNPYPYKYLSGTGTAFKVAQALLNHSMEENEAFEKWLLDLVSIGTIADIVPLLGENRTLVKYGLMVMNKTQRLGLRALIEASGLKGNGTGTIGANNHFNLSAWNIAFQIAPRINAAGRINHANEALELLGTQDESEARRFAEDLNTTNKERQRIAETVYKQALAQIGEVSEHDSVLIAYDPEWPIGVVGLVAGRIINQFYRPVILLTDAEGMITGSGRSIEGFDIVKALAKVESHLDRFGGHAMACGLKLSPEKLDAFKKDFREVVQQNLAKSDLQPELKIDLEIAFDSISWELAEAIQEFEPFGEANPQPLLLTKKVIVKFIDTVGAKSQHLKLTVSNDAGDVQYKTIGFNLANGWKEELNAGDKIDIVYELGFNEWNGNRELQIKLKDLRKSY